LKKCTKCKVLKNHIFFHKKTQTKDGLNTVCKECWNASNKEWRKNNPTFGMKNYRSWVQENPVKYKETTRKKGLRQYGLSIEDWEDIFNKQNGVCAICNLPETVIDKGTKRRLAVDHCHSTGKIRGLLCTKCNKGIGLLNDSPEILDKASAYLRKQN
jgi:hypothetical protein